MNRVNRITGHLNGNVNATSQVQSQNTSSSDDIVIVSAVRTPICRAKKGAFKDTHPTDLLVAALKGCIQKAGVCPTKVKDVVVGNVLAPGAFATHARMACLLAGMPESTACQTVNRQCSSGLQAFANVASAISSGFYDIGIAAGVESMSTMKMGMIGDISDSSFTHDSSKNCLIPMGVTSENVAEAYGITRDQQDAMAVESHRKALEAQKAGRFTEIIPVTTTVTDKEGNEKEVTVTADEGPRPGTTAAKLGKLRTVFKKNGTTTAGNASQISDGAAAVLLMKRSTALAMGLKPIGSFKSFAVMGCDPKVMGIGPAVAIPEALKQAGMSVGDVDLWEINEAFASQATYSVNKLGIPMEKVNPNGGAISLGHPLGCTGARQIATLLAALKNTGKQTGVVSMCIGTGMGAAAVFKAE